MNLLINNHTHLSVRKVRAKKFSEVIEESVISVYSLDVDEEVPNSLQTNEFFSFGLHPWNLNSNNSLEVIKDKFKAKFQNLINKKNLIAFGEIGLDKIHKETYEDQKKIFSELLKWKEEIAPQFPLILHCVRAFSDILNILKLHQPKCSIVFHDYNGNSEITKELLKYNVYFSLGQQLFQSNSKLIQGIHDIPIEKILIETDDHQRSIHDVYQRLSELRSEISLETLNDNFLLCYQSRLQDVEILL